MQKLEFSYNSLIADPEDLEKQDGGLISFNVDFELPPDPEEFSRTCYSIATDEVIALLSEKYGDDIFKELPELTIRISGLTIS